MFQQILQKLIQTQSQATENFYNCFQTFEENIKDDNQHSNLINADKNNIEGEDQTKQMKGVKDETGETQQFKVEDKMITGNDGENLDIKKEEQLAKKETKGTAKDSIKYENENMDISNRLQKRQKNKNNEENQESYLPSPKINMRKSQQNTSRKKLKALDSDGVAKQNSIQNQFHEISMDRKSKRPESQLQVKPIENKRNIKSLGNQDQTNPQQYIQQVCNPHITQISPQNAINPSNNPSFANVRLRKHIKVLDRNHISIRTQIKSLNNMNSYEQQNNIELPFFQQQSSKNKSNMRINSGIINISQSLRSSKEVNHQKHEIGTIKNIHLARRDLKQKQYSSLKKNKDKNLRYKTEGSMNRNSRIQEYYNSQLQAKIQLRMIFDKKKKLQQKLKKLNKQLQKLSTQQSQRIQQNMNSFQSPNQPLHKQKSSPIYNIFKSNKYSQNIMKRDMNKQHRNQLQNSRKAIQFVQKVSKQSMKRRISHNKKVNKIIIDRAKNHVCMDCSRVRCQAEVIEGEVRSSTHI